MRRLLTPQVLLLTLYFALNAVALVVWSARGMYGLSGDEPHYLIIADTLWNFGGLDVTESYTREFATNSLFSPGLALPGSPVTVPQAHVVTNSLGTFSFHAPLVGWLLAIPYGLFGVLGAKIAMMVLVSPTVIVLWKFGQRLLPRMGEPAQFVSIAALVAAYPLMLAPSQIYPDLLGGGIILLGLYWVISRDVSRSTFTVVSYSALIASLPWLGVKYLPIAGILFVFVILGERNRRAVVIPFVFVILAFVVFQFVIFGTTSGALQSDSFSVNGDLVIRFLGLILDQNQGFLFYQPLLWLGLAFTVPMIRQNPRFGLLWVMVFLGLIIPVAGHPVWYGGGSFHGRFGWALALLMAIPTLIGLDWLWNFSRKIFFSVLIVSFLFSGYIFVLNVFIGGFTPGTIDRLSLYNKPQDSWLESYSAHFFPLHDFFPAFYNNEWVWNSLVNWVWLSLAVVVICATVLTRSAFLTLVAVGAVALLVAGVTSTHGSPPVDQKSSASSADQVGAGVIVTGPERVLRWGQYEWGIEYLSSLPDLVDAGSWEIVVRGEEEVLASGVLRGTQGQVVRESVVVERNSFEPVPVVFRASWFGNGDMLVSRTFVSRVN